MFKRINIERARDGFSIKQLAERSDIKYDTLLAKLCGQSEFVRSEMQRIQKAFSNQVPLEELFESEDATPPTDKKGA